MEAFFSKAKAFAEETAKRSQELMTQTAQYSKEIARDAALQSKELAGQAARRTKELAAETSKQSKIFAEEAARRSKILAEEAAKRADLGYKSVTDLLSGTSVATGKSDDALESELQVYGITDELKEYVQSLTLSTFKDFPLDENKGPLDSGNAVTDSSEAKFGGPQVSEDLTEWQVHHAMLVLKAFPEISKFRYQLCPRFMKEGAFWKIYFVVVKFHIARYEADYNEKKILAAAAAESQKQATVEATESTKEAGKSADIDKDLDDYLMGALGDGDNAEIDDEDGDFDPEDFDQFVNDVVLEETGSGKGPEPHASTEEGDEVVVVSMPSSKAV